MKIFIVFFVFVYANILVASSLQDSLESLLPSLRGNQKIDVLNQLGAINRASKPMKSLEYSNQAIKLINQSTSKNEIFRTKYNLMYAYRVLQDELNYQKAKNDVYKLIDLMPNAQKAKAYSEIAKHFRRTDGNDSTIYYSQKAYNLLPYVRTATDRLDILNVQSNTYKSMGKYAEAIKLYDTLISEAEKSGKMFWKAIGLANKGLVMRDWKKFSIAIELLKESTSIYEKLNNNSNNSNINYELNMSLFNNYNNIAIVYNNLGKIDESENYLRLAYFYTQKIEDETSIAQIATNLANIFFNRKQFDSALSYYHISLDKALTLNALEGVGINYLNIGTVYFELGEYEKAIEFGLKAYYMIENQGYVYIKTELLNLLYNAYEKTNDYRNAYKYLLISKKLTDSIFSKESEISISTIEKSKQIDAEKHKNALLEERKKTERIIFVIVLIAILLLSILLSYGWWDKSKHLRLLKESKKEIEEKNKELEILVATKDKFFSIISHDLRNPFGSIIGILDVCDTMYDELSDIERKEFVCDLKTASRMVYNLLENLLTWSRSQRGLIEYYPSNMNLYEYVDINAKVLHSKFNEKGIVFENQVAPNFEIIADINMINTILRNILTNAVKFTENGGKISVEAERSNAEIRIKMKDTGVGISETDIKKMFRIDVSHTTIGTGKEKGTGLGLILCKEFASKHDGTITVESELGKGSTFTLIIPDRKA